MVSRCSVKIRSYESIIIMIIIIIIITESRILKKIYNLFTILLIKYDLHFCNLTSSPPSHTPIHIHKYPP